MAVVRPLPTRSVPRSLSLLCIVSSFACFVDAFSSGSVGIRSVARPASTSCSVDSSLLSRSTCRGRSNTCFTPTRLFMSQVYDEVDDWIDPDSDSRTCTCIQFSQPTSGKTRRRFFLQQILAASSLSMASPLPALPAEVSSYFSLSNNNNIPQNARDRRPPSSSSTSRRPPRQQQPKMLLSTTKKWTPFANIRKWTNVETCLLELLPVKNGVFRRLQESIENYPIPSPEDIDGWERTADEVMSTLALLESKRSMLEPVFNQDDSTELFIRKSSIGEGNVERLRGVLENLIRVALGRREDESIESIKRSTNGNNNSKNNNNRNDVDKMVAFSGSINVDAFTEGRRRALLALAELGELLVPSFPYAVPTRGKFGYLPRLLGRCTVTFTFERPPSTVSNLGFAMVGGGGDKRILGNVTIVADGYAAPITAGNFVDLSLRNFYTGLNVKAVRKRLGVVPSWSDNVIVNDLTELKDNFDVLADDFGSDLSNAERRLRFFQTGNAERGAYNYDANSASTFEDERVTMDAVIPILGSFQEGFYDPLTAKPRRIPLELVALDPSSPTKTTLTYSSSFASLDVDVAAAGTTTYSEVISSSSPQRSFSSAISPTSSNSTAAPSFSNLDPVLSFDIPNLVAMNHPDRMSNGGSSEFFALPIRDISTRRTELLDGQYAPFGYIVDGSDVYQMLRPGDVIKATYVSEVGQLNLVKIRKNAFEGASEEEGNFGDEEEKEKEEESGSK